MSTTVLSLRELFRRIKTPSTVIQTPKAIYIFEFKLDNDPTAWKQIKEKEYFKKYLLDKRDIYIVGVNFDSVKGNLIGWEDEKLDN